MPEWSTYELSNFLLFSPRAYDRMLESYNAAMWPGQFPAVLSGIAIVLLSLRRGQRAPAAAAILLSLAWLWVAWAFHFQRYAPINWAARGFGLAFVLQGVLIVATEWRSRALARHRGTSCAFTEPARPDKAAFAGLLLATFAIVALPVVQRLLGRPWTQVEVFALFPDATALATLGVLAARDRVAWYLLPIPLLWCVIGAGTLAAMERQDAGVILGMALFAIGVLARKAVVLRRARVKA